MTKSFAIPALAALALLATQAGAQEVAGRVLVAVGDVSIERGNQKVDTRVGTEVRAGDLFVLGPQSNAQLRLTDESIIALRSDTTFRLTEYSFQDRKPEEQKSLFNLVKGGMRTVTGLIGRSQRQNYAVRTPNATIGIRGTHYTLVHCEKDCGPPGAKADAGVQLAQAGPNRTDAGAPGTGTPGVTFGAVTEGNIGVSNQSGEHQIGPDQYFRVASIASTPERLIAPPQILRDTLEARARSQKKPEAGAQPGQPGQQASSGSQQGGTGKEAANTVAPTGPGASLAAGGLTATVGESQVRIVTRPVIPAEDARAAGEQVLASTSNTGTVFYRIDGGVVVQGTSDGHPSQITVDFLNVGVNLGLGVARVSLGVRGDDNGRVNLSTPADIPVKIVDGQLKFNATFLRSAFPLNSLAFRCQTCGPGDSVGFVDSFTVDGTISGGTVTVTVSVTDQFGGGSATATLPTVTPPNDLAAAMVIPRLGGGANTLTTSTFGVTVDGAGKPTSLSSGLLFAQVGGATNHQVGFDAAAGNLRWGHWSGASNIVRDANYNSLTGSFEPWIVGQFPNTVPSSLGSVTYTPIGSAINSGFAVLNSASLTADFLNRTMGVSMSVTRTSGELNTFTMAGSTTFSPINATFGAGFSSLSCSGTCTTGGNQLGGSFGGFFSGKNAEGAGVAFTAGYGIGTGVTGVVAFKR